MGEELAKGDRFFSGTGEFRQVAAERRFHVELAGFYQLHHGRCGGDHLGQRSRVEDGVLRHDLALRDDHPVAVGFLIDRAGPFHPEHRAGSAGVGDGLLDGVVDLRQEAGRKARLGSEGG